MINEAEQNELMKKEKKHSMIERSSFSWRRSSFTEICNANRVTLFKSEATDWLSLYDLISITFLINSLLDLYVQHVLSLLFS